jgi:hypothetical protein
MIGWEETGAGIRVFDGDNSSISVGAADLDVSAPGRDIRRPVEATLDVRSNELRFPVAVVYVSDLARDQRYEIGNETDPLQLPDGEYVVDVDAPIKTYLHASGSVTIRKTAEFEQVVVTFPEKRQVTLGFRSRHEKPDGVIDVPRIPSGVATALSHMHASHKTTGPDRSYPTLRGHPPLIRPADSASVPDAILDATPDTDIELVVPDDLANLFVLAPLAHYLQATVRVEPCERPVLLAPSVGIERSFEPMPGLERDATRVLRKVFFMDCLVRNAGPYGTNLAEKSLLDTLELDAARLYEADPDERLGTYLSIPHAAIEQRLPDWHLSTYVDPVPGHVDTLPFLLANLSLIYTPETSELEGSELVERSLGDFYRSDRPGSECSRPDPELDPRSAFAGTTRRQSSGKVATVEIVKPELRNSRIHGWLASGTPIDVFKSTPEAYRNRLDYLGRESDTTRITVVSNDDEMYDEHVDVEAIYRDRAEDLPIDVEVYDRLSTVDLATVFESERDFVHYIGHCERDGLRCPDGFLSATNLSECNAQTFFLNACGSYYEGLELVEQGAVAGAITFSQVLNEHAVTVGSAFARLMIHGFSIERALQLARRRIMMGKDYAVVGDGTHVLTQSKNRLPATATLESIGRDQYLLTYDQFSAPDVGGYYYPYVGDNEYSYLCGNESEYALDATEVQEFLRRAEMPVIYEGDFYWSDELWETLVG